MLITDAQNGRVPAQAIGIVRQANRPCGSIWSFACYGGLLLALAISGVTQLCANPPIERLQRELQARHYFLTQDYYSWPDCRDGKAPAFPKDGFYGDISLDPELGVRLVRDVAGKFYLGPPDRRMYRHFLNTDDGKNGIEGYSTVDSFLFFEFPFIAPEDINKDSYLQKLQTLLDQVLQLKWVFIDNRWYDAAWNAGVNKLEEAVQQGGNFRLAEGRVESSDQQLTPAQLCDNSKLAAIANLPGELEAKPYIGYRLSTWASACAFTHDGNARIDQSCGSVSCNLLARRYIGGEGWVFSLARPGSDWFSSVCPVGMGNVPVPVHQSFFSVRSPNADIGPPLTPDNTFRLLEMKNGDPCRLIGGTIFQSDDYACGLPVNLSSDWPDCGRGDGWEIVQSVGTFKPVFDTTPDPDDCCGCDCEFGTVKVELGSVSIRVDLGPGDLGRSEGFLRLHEREPTDVLGARLRFSVGNDDRAVLYPSTAQNYTMVQRIYFRLTSNLVALQRENHSVTATFYTGVSGAAAASGAGLGNGTTGGTMFKSLTILNPEMNTNIVVVLEEFSGESRVSTYSRAGTGDAWTWTLTTGGTTAADWLRKELSQNARAGDIRDETYSILNPDSSIAYQEIRQYKKFSFGEKLVRVGVTDEGVQTLHDYFEAGPHVGQLKETYKTPLGFWQRFQYDGQNRLVSVVSQFKDHPRGSPAAANRETKHLFAGQGDFEVQEYLQDELVSRSATTFEQVSGFVLRTDSRFKSPDLENNDGLVTTTMYRWQYVQDASAFIYRWLDWQPVETWYPDGTMERRSFDYGGGLRTLTVERGTWVVDDDEALVFVKGTRHDDEINPGGYLLKRKYYLFQDTSLHAAGTEIYSLHDPHFRPGRVDYPDGSFTLASYDCCGTGTFTDRDGVVTTTLHDNLHRQTGYIDLTHDITVQNILDAAGQVRLTTRRGGTHAPIVQRTASYDRAGRVVAEYRPLDGATTHQYEYDTGGGLIHTTTFANEGTRVETSFSDGQLKEISGTAAYPMTYDYGVAANHTFTREFRGPGTAEWIERWYDMLGRAVLTVLPGGSATVEFDPQGRPWRRTDPDGVTSILEYDDLSRVRFTTLDADGSRTRTVASNDRIRETQHVIVWEEQDLPDHHPIAIEQTITRAWPEDFESDVLTTRMVETSIFATNVVTKIWKDAANPATVVAATNVVRWNHPAPGQRTATAFAPDGTKTVSLYVHGRLKSVTLLSRTDQMVGRTTYEYDHLGRLWKSIDERNGATTTTYNNADQPLTVTTPPPGTGQPAQTTAFQYDLMGQVGTIIHPDGTSIANAYTLRGELTGTWGSRIYPVGYDYDAQGRLRHMTNWGTFSTLSTPRITQWNYHPARGWLAGKRYPHAATGDPSDVGPDYTYTAAGRLQSRVWARGGNAAAIYSYDTAGDLRLVDHLDGTPDVEFAYDRRGRLKRATETTPGNAAATRVTTLSYNDANQPTGESVTVGGAGQPGVSVAYDEWLRRQQFDVTGAGQAVTTGYGYDTASRLETVTMGGASATYSYLANSPLVEKTEFQHGATARMTTTRQFDRLNRLTAIGSARPAGSGSGTPPLPSFAYLYNSANQRTRSTLADGSYWVYNYDALGQVRSGKRYWSDGTPVAGQQFEYGFDDIGNRTDTKSGGDALGAGLRWADYTPNRLNQYEQRTVPDAFDVIGAAHATASVTVNGAAAYRRGEYFRGEVTVDNATPHAAYASVAVSATLGGNTDTLNKHEYVPPATELFTHDDDGNLTGDGRWDYTWDGENRLIQMETHAAATGAGVPYRRLEFGYDWRGRRVSKKAWTTQGGLPTTDLRFVHDGWNLAAELDGANSVVRSYAWGLDLSGSRQGAGGVGGLLAVNVPGSGPQFAAYDGNGNVAGLLQASDGAVTASYEYGAFGELIRSSGPLAEANPVRFSTKYLDAETGLSYYGYRYYDSSTGRWLNRDPLGEAGGVNLYGFVGNGPLNAVDALGLYQEGGHYYTTFIAAVIAGKRDSAQSLAFYSQLPDELKSQTAWYVDGDWYNPFSWDSNAGKAAGNLLSPWTVEPEFDALQRFLHSLDGGLAKPRRDCLRKLVQDMTLQPWEHGLLLHAFGDSYAHSYVDSKPYLPITSVYGPVRPISNPHYGQELLYSAPLGHGAEGSKPDYVSLRPALYGQYLTDLTTTLNGGLLNSSQTAQLQSVLNQVNDFPKATIGDLEIVRFRGIALQFGYPRGGYRPEANHALSATDFLAGPAKGLGFGIPSGADVNALLDRIKKACCGK